MPSEPFEFDISAAKDKKRRRGVRTGMSGAVETSSRTCDHPSCNKVGKFRAPKASGKPGEYHWFCRQHVKQYNLNWDYFRLQNQENESNGDDKNDGLTPEQRRKILEDLSWARFGIKDPFEVLGESGTVSSRNGSASGTCLTRNEQRALDILDANGTWGKAEIRKQYRSLVKDLHPDMNDGDRRDEDRLKEVVWAWDQIKDSRNFKP